MLLEKTKTQEKCLYIYNLKQANFFMSRGIMPTRVGIHNKTQKVYVLFEGSKRTEEVFKEWCDFCNAIRTN